MLSVKYIEKLVNETDCKPYKFNVGCILCDRETVAHKYDCIPFLQAKLWRKDADTGVEGWGHSSKYLLSSEMSEGEIVKKCFVAARDYAEHEVREAFMWRGKRILGPHVPLEALYEASSRTK